MTNPLHHMPWFWVGRALGWLYEHLPPRNLANCYAFYRGFTASTKKSVIENVVESIRSLDREDS
jgi:hypothetical protein